MNTGNKAKTFGILAIVLCAVCCALPVIGAGIGMASLAAFAFYSEKIGMAALAIAAFLFWYAWHAKRKKAKAVCTNSCSSDCDCKTQPVTSE